MRRVDFGETARDYARHRLGFPDSLFERLAVLASASRASALSISAPEPAVSRAASRNAAAA